MELGIYTFGDRHDGPVDRPAISTEQRLANLLEEVELADQVGLDVFGIGEHHRPDYRRLGPGGGAGGRGGADEAHPAHQRRDRAVARTIRSGCSRSSRPST